MAGRCPPCASTTATGASIAEGDCISVTGAGTTTSPAEISVVVDPDTANNLQCGPSGLFAASVQVEPADNCIDVAGDGSFATPYEVGLTIDPAAGNGITCETDGLYATRATHQLAGAATLFGGLPPADPHELKIAGTIVDTTNVAGHIVVPITVTIDGIYTIVYSLGDVPGVLTFHSIDYSTVGLTQFDVVFQDDAGVAIVGGTYRINYEITAWFTP